MRNFLSNLYGRAILGTGLVMGALVAPAASLAAADPTTGIDYSADLANPALDAIKPAIIAGLLVLVVFVAVSGGKKMWGKVTGTK
jgi:hypothetical protein